MGARIIINIGDKFGYLKVVSEIEPHITPCGTIRRRIDEYGYTIAEALGFEIHNKKQYDRNNRRKKILQYSLSGELIKEWESVNEIYDVLGISINAIRKCASGVRKTSNGFIWKYKK